MPAVSPDAAGELAEIGWGEDRAVIGAVAATLLSWRTGDTELLLTHDPAELGDSHQGKAIAPWPNRIAAGRYTFEGHEYQVALTEPARDAALHGLLTWVEWDITERHEHAVTLEHHLRPQYGYPFSLHLRLTYALGDGGLRCTLQATNTGTGPAPFGAAYHPYVRLTDTVDELIVDLPADTYYPTDANLIPTGRESVEGTEFDFRGGRKLGTTALDTAYTGLAADADGITSVRLTAPSGRTVTVWADAGHRYLQVYTDDVPGTGRPARRGITVEPMTCAPNAFNTGDGLLTLAPGESFTGSWGLSHSD
ncbi:aldose 1-epimerase family protein [Amycolatopsis magusensis]|uniref:aldose 1-epimerase family protein n=1 Tax=Amycolatopsis magusensis TaxID=882444 RepID=UPI0024A8F1D2|nr:aldose 1-epimerase family protein [Amycolatopsis magusensis]MDI5975462.1 aldose 1-epimerase family protein [Amycolatopsis magusensis]